MTPLISTEKTEARLLHFQFVKAQTECDDSVTVVNLQAQFPIPQKRC